MARPKKRGVKPGTKRGPYKKASKRSNKPMSLENYSKQILEPSVAKFRLANEDWAKLNSVGNLPSLISDLTSTIDTLEAQLTAQIDRIKSILN